MQERIFLDSSYYFGVKLAAINVSIHVVVTTLLSIQLRQTTGSSIT
jgi:hypothetical protein